ncbi:hypothetical protein [Demequina capsici]|uniref:Uncharacterized protein n=1 Tax=Demequina capsici TaxID=3075620 RepID=A0AA96J828_9MICO|nr:hypothetical protein [Demequina sp. OYTSA14]WNM24628.1 hypothetical protein RN606_00320 [Demequina sp. OYTSA14]
MRVSPWRRMARALGGSALSTFAALGSHVLAGGHSPTVIGVAVPLALAFVVCFHLAGRALTLTRLTLAVLLSQGLFHLLFAWGTADVALTGQTHAHHLEPGALGVTATHAAHSGSGMMLAHVLAAVATIAAIHRADDRWRTLGRALGHVLDRWRDRLVVHVPAVEARPATTIPAHRPAGTQLAIATQPALLRGPPQLSLPHPRPA